MQEYYIYHLIDPRTDLPFYIGKGKNGRMFNHEKCVKRNEIPNKNKHLFYKIKEILTEGLSIKYKKVYDNLEEKEAWLKEIEEEKRLKEIGVKLCNLVPCGCGGDTLSNHPDKVEIFRKIGEKRPKQLSEKWKHNISVGLTGRKASLETRKKLSISLTGEKNPMFGKTFSEEIRKKISDAGVGRVFSKETREKIGKAHKGKILSEETKLKLSKANKGRKFSVETCQKMSVSHTGLLFSTKRCENISNALKGRIFSENHKKKLSDIAKSKIGRKNPNFRPISSKSIDFIKSNIGKTPYWIYTHIGEKISYGRIKRRIEELKNISKA